MRKLNSSDESSGLNTIKMKICCGSTLRSLDFIESSRGHLVVRHFSKVFRYRSIIISHDTFTAESEEAGWHTFPPPVK